MASADPFTCCHCQLCNLSSSYNEPLAFPDTCPVSPCLLFLKCPSCSLFTWITSTYFSDLAQIASATSNKSSLPSPTSNIKSRMGLSFTHFHWPYNSTYLNPLSFTYLYVLWERKMLECKNSVMTAALWLTHGNVYRDGSGDLTLKRDVSHTQGKFLFF